MTRLNKLTTQIEQISIDEAFLDITGLPDSPEHIARSIQTEIRAEMGLPSSIGIASNKLVAKIATEVGKKAGSGAIPPFGLTIVPAGEEAFFLAPLPAEMLWGVGPKTSSKLTELGIHTIGDIAKWPEVEMVRLFGENGRELAWHSRGLDDRPIVTEHETKSISQETTYTHDVREDKVLEKTLHEQSDQVARKLRESNLAGTTIKLKLRWPDFTTLTRQTTLTHSTDQADEIGKAVLGLLKAVRKPGQAVRLIGVGVSGLTMPVRQLALWDTGSEKSRRLQQAIDELREKYGEKVIFQGDIF
jgi:DNA polymerase-4